MGKVIINGIEVAKFRKLSSVEITGIKDIDEWNLEVDSKSGESYSLDHIGGRPNDRNKSDESES